MISPTDPDHLHTGSLISVIVPCYNVRPYLRRCIDSIAGQANVNLEVIMVDDGSTDGTSELCDAIAASNRRTRVIHKANGGLSDARNAGLDSANGPIVTFVDSDDFLPPGAIGTMLTLMLLYQYMKEITTFIKILIQIIINIIEITYLKW